MFSNQEKALIKCRASIGRWNATRAALVAYTTVPAGVSIWEIVTTHNLKLLLPYSFFVGMTVICQVVSSGKVEFYKAIIEILERRIEHSPTSNGLKK